MNVFLANQKGFPILRRFHVTRLLVHLALFIISLAFLAPLVLVLSASFSDEQSISQYGFTLLPLKFSTLAYHYILQGPSQIIQAYGVSIFVTVVGSALSLLIMSLFAYTLAQSDYALRRPLSFYVFFTMLFNGGLVPFYILITQYLHIQDTLLVLILPHLVVPWYVLLLRTYFSALPQDLLDSARIDGAGEWCIFFQIVLPLSAPALATVGLFCMLIYWNDWWLGLLFINDTRLIPLQLLLYKIIANVDLIISDPHLQNSTSAIPIQSVRMAVAVLAIAPLVPAFIFVQRYFVRGITVGGLKE